MCFAVTVVVGFNIPAKSNGNSNLQRSDSDEFPVPVGMYRTLR